MTLFETFSNLRNSWAWDQHSENEWPSLPINGSTRVLLSMNRSDQPAILLEELPYEYLSARPPIRLRYLDVRFGQQVTRRDPNGTLRGGVFTTIEFLGGPIDVLRVFLDSGEAIAPYLEDASREIGAREAATAHVELFRSLDSLSKQSEIGLWGELFAIQNVEVPGAMLDCWHQNANSGIDFECGEFALEVKTACAQERRHNFSIKQVGEADVRPAFLLSLLIENSQDGNSITDLIDRITARTGSRSDGQLKLELVAAAVLGADWRMSKLGKYALVAMNSPIRLYRMRDVPRPGLIPDTISSLRYTADLSEIPALGKGDLFVPSNLRSFCE